MYLEPWWILDPASFADECYAGYRPAMTRINNGNDSWANVGTIYRRRLDEILEKFKNHRLYKRRNRSLQQIMAMAGPLAWQRFGTDALKEKFILSTQRF
jgi:hypothetical protein